MTIELIDNHADRSVGLLVEQYRTKVDFAKLVDVFVRQLQEVEQALFDVFTLTALGTAEGVQLDLLGEALGSRRLGRDDDTYRLVINTQIVRNLAQGEVGPIFTMVEALTSSDNIELTELFPAKIRILFDGDTTTLAPDDFFAVIKSVVAAGVGFSVTQEQEFPFIWSGVTAPDPDGPDAGGWGTVSDPSIGGQWSTVLFESG